MKFDYLDGLRGLAALIVVIDHFAISFFPAAVDGSVKVLHGGFEPFVQLSPLHLLVAGNFSVCIFFALSGFVLSARYFQTHSRRAVIAGARRRYLRLSIPVLASVMLAFVLISFHAFSNRALAEQTGSQWLNRFWNIRPNFLDALYHGAVGVFIGRPNDGYNTVLWTMQTELIGSFLVFTTLFAFGNWRYRKWIYALLLLIFAQSYYVAFMAGLIMCDICHTSRRLQVGARLWVPLLLVGLYLGACPVDTLAGTPYAILQNRLPGDLPVGRTLHIVGAILVLMSVVSAAPLQRMLSRKPLVYFGKLSFSLYLTHLFILGSVTSALFLVFQPQLGYGYAFCLSALLSAPVIAGVAHLFYRYIDTIAIKTTRRVDKLISS